jgi:hypothetical protein
MTILSTNTTRSRTFAGIDREALSRSAVIAAAAIFAIAGLVIVAIGAAFPLALAVVESRDLQVPAADLALAQRIEPYWPAIVAIGVANLAAAFAALDRGALGKRIGLVVAGTSAALATVVQVALAVQGESAIVASVVASIFAVALLAMVMVERRSAAA